MNKIFKIILAVAVLKNFAFCQQYYPFPYAFQNEDYAIKSFASFFNLNAIEGRNDTPATTPPTSPATSATTKKPEPTTETIVYIPIIQETVYEPDYYPYPPHPIFYNAPPEDAFGWDNFGAYPAIQMSPLVVPSGVQLPLANFQPDRINHRVPLPVTQTPKPSAVAQVEDVEITDAERDALAMELMKIINGYLSKKQQKLEAELQSYTEKNPDSNDSDSDDSNSYKVIEPSSTTVPEVMTGLPNTLSVSAQVNTTSNETLDGGNGQPNGTDKILDRPLAFNWSYDNGTERTNITQTTVTNEPTETDQPVGTEESRKLDFDTSEGETTDIVTTDRLSPILSKNFWKIFGHGSTSANGSKWNDRFKGISTAGPNGGPFVDNDGNNCSVEVVTEKEKMYNIYTCVEKTFHGEIEVNRMTTYKSDVTYFTEEMTTEPVSQISTVIDGGRVTKGRVTDNDLTSTSEAYDTSSVFYDTD